MAKSAETGSAFVGQIRFVARQSGAVKQLRGFKKSHHSLPDAVNQATSGFLARLCVDELSEEGEMWFQRVRTVFGYKRKDLALDVSTPTAVLTARDFVFELAYALDEKDPASYVVTKALHNVRNADVVQLPEMEEVFEGAFSEIAFGLKKGARVEAVIDAVEALPEEAKMRVTYPSDYRDCTLSVDGVQAEVKFDGPELTMIFPRAGTPRELFEAFAAVRAAFALTKDKALSGLLG
jgi:hypothetical protein